VTGRACEAGRILKPLPDPIPLKIQFPSSGSASWLLLYPYVFHVVLPLYRRLGVISAYEYLERRFDLRVRLLAAGIFLLWRMGWMANC